MRLPRPSLRSHIVACLLAVGLAACGGGGGGESTSADVEPDVSVLGTDALKFQPESLTAEAGEVAVELTTGPAVNHDFVIDGETVVAAPKGASEVGTIELDAGEYTFYCSIPGHRTAGMAGTLTVQ